jgi:hypothetical protein
LVRGRSISSSTDHDRRRRHDRAPPATLHVARSFRLRRWRSRPGLADREQHLGGLEGFGEVVVGAAAHRLEREFLGAVRGHQDQRGVGTPPRQLRQQRQTVDAGHAQIAEHDVGHRVVDPRQRIGAVAREARFVALRAEHERQALAQLVVVVHDQNTLRQEASTRCVSVRGGAEWGAARRARASRGIAS